MTDTTQIVDTYISAWNEADAARRAALVARAWADGGTYLDPLAQGAGHAEIAGLIGAVQAQYPGTTFRLVAAPDAHHDRVRFTWQLVPGGGGPALATGYDFATLAADGRLQDVTGFLEITA